MTDRTMSDEEACEIATDILKKHDDDPIASHSELDRLLCLVLESTHPELVEIFESSTRWYT